MNTAAMAREAMRAHPFLHQALRAGVLNYTAAARYLDLEDVEAGAAALRRLHADLSAPDRAPGDFRVRIDSTLGPVPAAEALLTVGDTAVGRGSGVWAGVLAEGAISSAAVGAILQRAAIEGIEPVAVGYDDCHLVLVVERDDGPRAIRIVEETPVERSTD